MQDSAAAMILPMHGFPSADDATSPYPPTVVEAAATAGYDGSDDDAKATEAECLATTQVGAGLKM